MLRSERNRIIFHGWTLEPFHPDDLGHQFDCGKTDLNDFFANDVLNYETDLMAKTYVLSPVGATASEGHPPTGFISYCNDAIVKEIFVDKLGGTQSQWNKLRKLIPRKKRFNSLPAVKIARLGVQKIYKKRGAGTALLNMTKRLFLTENRTGCRFLTVDAYITLDALALYTANYFSVIPPQDEQRCIDLLNQPGRDEEAATETVAMFYDLSRTLSEGEEEEAELISGTPSKLISTIRSLRQARSEPSEPF